jgi:hypothetical protein
VRPGTFLEEMMMALAFAFVVLANEPAATVRLAPAPRVLARAHRVIQ